MLSTQAAHVAIETCYDVIEAAENCESLARFESPALLAALLDLTEEHGDRWEDEDAMDAAVSIAEILDNRQVEERVVKLIIRNTLALIGA